MAWAKNGTPNTLSSTADTVDITDLTSKKYNQTLAYNVASGTVNLRMYYGNGSIDTGTNYAYRKANNGNADATSTSQAELNYNSVNSNSFIVKYTINIATEEKLEIAHTVEQNTAGEATAPARTEVVAKWDNTSNQYDQIRFGNTSTGDFDSGTNLSALGTD